MIGVDLKLDETKEAWYFLEANPIPCYYGYDIRSGYRISKSICDFLAG
jgi:hypothetical protein